LRVGRRRPLHDGRSPAQPLRAAYARACSIWRVTLFRTSEWPGRPAATRPTRTSRERRMVEQKPRLVVKRIQSANMD
jgi:hypothetical protein